MKYIYSLRIDCGDTKPEVISEVLDVECTNRNGKVWNYEIVENENDPRIDFVNVFLDMLEGKYIKLQKTGIELEQISLWMYYEYEQQCNMEFLPKNLKRIGDNGLTFCISCWEKE